MVAARVYYTADLQENHEEVGVVEVSKNQVKGFVNSPFKYIPKKAQQSELSPNTSSKRKGPIHNMLNNSSSYGSD